MKYLNEINSLSHAIGHYFIQGQGRFHEAEDMTNFDPFADEFKLTIREKSDMIKKR